MSTLGITFLRLDWSTKVEEDRQDMVDSLILSCFLLSTKAALI